MKTQKQGIKIWTRNAQRWFAYDWEAKLVSLVLACFVWYIVKNIIKRENEKEKPYPHWTPPMLQPPVQPLTPVPRVDGHGDVR